MRICRKIKPLKILRLLVVSCLLGFLLAEAGLRFGSFCVRSWHNHKNSKSLAAKNAELTILCVGESTTYKSYPEQLQRILDADLGTQRVRVIDSGTPAALTSRIVAEFKQTLNKFKPDIVLCMIGINDAYDFSKQENSFYGQSFLTHFRLFRLMRNIYSKRFKKTPKRRLDPPFRNTENLPPLSAEAQKLSAKISSYRYVVLQSSPLPKTATPNVDGVKHTLNSANKKSIYNAAGVKGFVLLAQSPNTKNNPAKVLNIYESMYERFPYQSSLYEHSRVFLDTFVASTDAQYLYQCIHIARRCLKFDADNQNLYAYIWRALKRLGNADDIVEFKREMVVKFPQDIGNYYELAYECLEAGLFDEALNWFEVVLKHADTPELRQAVFTHIWECLLRSGRSFQLEAYMRKWQTGFSKSQRLRFLRMLKARLLDNAKLADAKKLELKIVSFESDGINQQTQHNYRRICSEALNRKKVFIAMQYPLRSVDVLHTMLAPFADRIWFFSNRNIFQNAIVRDGLETYFSDMFADDFGHTTSAGSQLLAQSIAAQLYAGPLKHLRLDLQKEN